MKTITISAWLLYLLYAAIVIISLIFYFALADEKNCMNNPMIYGANKAITEDSGELTCSCVFSNPEYAPFYFNRENMSIDSNLG